jgi:hypothetical protein
LVWYAGDPCDLSIQQYNQMLLDRQQGQWDFSVAEPLRRQITVQQREIADQQNQIRTLQATIDSQTIAAIQREASNRASLDMLGAILGVGLGFFAAYATFRRLARRAPHMERVQYERGRAASASS